ncbi:MAG: inositol monophosphatase family protein [Candidatus Promineifilaceae bacterium]
MMTNQLQHYLEFATETAWQAGRLTLGYFQTGIRPDFKSDETPVTVADREAERLIRGRIEKAFPSHAIVGEEFGSAETDEGASHRWFIDPIDGTRAFVRGVPLYGVLIGLEIDGEIQVGVANFPAMGEMLTAAKGLGCWWNGRKAQVSQITRLEDGILTHTNPASFAKHGRAEAWEQLQNTVGYCFGWSDCYGYLLVATGRVEVMLDPIMSVWDCGPFPVILQEAGGYFGDWQGNPTIYGSEAMATTAVLLPQVLELIGN